jgi:NAD(P)-dependent dehydrogenase (short-subunit alcohol dehydrogenase family)
MVTIAVIGASGDVGRGIVTAASVRGWSCLAAARSESGLASAAAEAPGPGLVTSLRCDVTDAVSLEALATAVAEAGVTCVVAAVNSAIQRMPLLQWQPEQLWNAVLANLAPHLQIARAVLGRLPADGLLLGIGGGTADFVLPELAPLSLVQSAQRMLYRALAKERPEGTAQVKEVIIASMVSGRSNREQARRRWVTDREVGEYVCELIAQPDSYREDVLILTPETLRH